MGLSLETGNVHTLPEILQQPETWRDTCRRLIAHRDAIRERMAGIASVVLTGSGSSQFAGECVRAVLEKELGIGVEVVDGGALLMRGAATMPAARPALVVSLARSGNSPESVGAVSLLIESAPEVRHLILTCNGEGGLAKTLPGETVVLDPRTNDRSLVMTSSFTNLVLAARFLGLMDDPERYRRICDALADMCQELLARYSTILKRVARADFDRVVYLGSAVGFGAGRECSLKMLEMTAGRVATMAETYLGLRHGPMSFVNGRTLVVCFLSSDPHLRDYEFDLIRELNRKQLGAMKVLVGENIDRDLLMESDHSLEIPGIAGVGDDNAVVLHVTVGQLLAFFRCIEEGLKPDAPSENGVINRVVEEFPIYRREGEGKS
jgi:tagatose-6-phosphate ketose/aldose isomerase